MNKEHRLLVINVGSTSTKAAFFQETTPVVSETIMYNKEALSGYSDLSDQLSRREEDLLNFTKKNNINLEEID